VATNHKPDGRGQRRTDMAQEGDQTWNTDPRLTDRWPRPRCLHGESVGGWESALHHRDARDFPPARRRSSVPSFRGNLRPGWHGDQVRRRNRKRNRTV